MKKYFAFLMMVAAALVGCSQEEQPNVVEQPEVIEQPETPTTYTMTVTATKSNDALTRALSLGNDGSTLNAMWKAGEKIQVASPNLETNSIEEIGTLTAQSDGTTTTFTGTLDKAPTEGYNILLTYPKYFFDYTGQKGTLDDIAANYDYVSGIVKATDWTIEDGVITTNTPVEFTNIPAIVRFILQDKDGNDIEASSLNISDEKNSIYKDEYTHGDITITPENPASEIWAAVCSRSNINITLTATTEQGDVYTYTKSVVRFTQGQFYSITVKMTKLLSLTVRDETSEDVGNQTIYYLDGETWADAIANHPTVNAGWAITGNGNVVVYNGYSLCYYDEEDTAVTKDDVIDTSINYYLIWD